VVLTKFNILVILLKTCQYVVELVIQRPPIVEMIEHHQQIFFLVFRGCMQLNTGDLWLFFTIGHICERI